MQKRFFSLELMNQMRQRQRIWDTEDGKKAPKAPALGHLGKMLRQQCATQSRALFKICFFSILNFKAVIFVLNFFQDHAKT
jgi:hypothetical protein